MNIDEWVAKDDSAAPGTTVTPEPAPETPGTQEPSPETGGGIASEAGGAQAAADAAKAAGASDAEARQAAQEFIEAQLDGKPFKIPANALIPVKRGKDESFVPLSQARTEYMLRNDYNQRVQEAVLARRREEAEHRERMQTVDRERVVVEARRAALEAERRAYLEAQTDPEKREAYDRRLAALEADPELRRRWERGLDGQVDDALHEFDARTATDRKTEDIFQNASRYIETEAAKHAGVDPQRVRQAYALAWYQLQSVTDPAQYERQYRELVSADFVDALFAEEQATYDRLAAPLSGELAEIKKQLAEVKASQDAGKHNAETAAKIAAAKAPGVRVATGAAPAPSNGSPKLDHSTPESRAAAVRAWTEA